MLGYFLKGFGLSAGLIVAIGAQNAHVLKIGLKREHVGMTVAICIACEIAVIIIGVSGMGALVSSNPALLAAIRWSGTLFLVWYGLRALRAAWNDSALQINTQPAMLTVRQAALTVLALTLLNPHFYLDTVVLLGSIGAQQAADGKPWFTAGAIIAASVWFILLGFGARLLAPWFAKPSAWRILDAGIACVMFGLAASLVLTR